jgi:3-hydroxyacyl-[acyl-carrier-protein] dehydratase
MTDIADHLPHRFPFLLVDRILDRQPGLRVVAEKLVGAEAAPSTLLVEMLAQTAGFLEPDSLHGQRIFLAGIPEARFEAPVRPGDRLRLEVTPEGAFAGVMKVRGTVRCGNETLCSAALLVKRL